MIEEQSDGASCGALAAYDVREWAPRSARRRAIDAAEVIAQLLNAVDAWGLDVPLRDLADRRKGDAGAGRDLSLRLRRRAQRRHHVVVDWGGGFHAPNHTAIYGQTQWPHIDKVFADNPAMDITAVIARNLDALISAHQVLDTSEKVAAASGVGYGTVRRTRKGEGNVTVQNLEAIAGAFRRHAVDLMTEGGAGRCAPESPPQRLFRVSEAEAIPPDERLLIHGYRAASDDLRDIMLDVARRAVAKREQPGRSDHQ